MNTARDAILLECPADTPFVRYWQIAPVILPWFRLHSGLFFYHGWLFSPNGLTDDSARCGRSVINNDKQPV